MKKISKTNSNRLKGICGVDLFAGIGGFHLAFICQVRAVTKKGIVTDYDRELGSYRDEKYCSSFNS